MGMAITESDNGTKEEVKKQIILISKEMEQEIADELQSIMENLVLPRAIELCPKDTGALASSITLTGGAIQKSANVAGDFYECSIGAGDPNVINPKSGKGTDEYAYLIEEGHFLKNGQFYQVAFLEDALAEFQAELENAVFTALQQLVEESGSG